MRFVHEVAEELEMTPKGFMEWCRKHNVHVTSTVSLIDEDVYQLAKKTIKVQKGMAVIDALCEEKIDDDDDWEVVDDDFPNMSKDYIAEMTDRIIQQEIDIKRGK